MKKLFFLLSVVLSVLVLYCTEALDYTTSAGDMAIATRISDKIISLSYEKCTSEDLSQNDKN
jgi:hypothetical protein